MNNKRRFGTRLKDSEIRFPISMHDEGLLTWLCTRSECRAITEDATGAHYQTETSMEGEGDLTTRVGTDRFGYASRKCPKCVWNYGPKHSSPTSPLPAPPITFKYVPSGNNSDPKFTPPRIFRIIARVHLLISVLQHCSNYCSKRARDASMSIINRRCSYAVVRLGQQGNHIYYIMANSPCTIKIYGGTKDMSKSI